MLVSAGNASSRLIVSLFGSLAGPTHHWIVSYIPDLNIATAVVLGPHTEDVFLLSDTQDRPANLIAGFQELVSDDGQHETLPVPICHSLLQPHNPLAAFLVGIVFPHRPDALLENVIVGDGREKRRRLEVAVYRPEALRGTDGCNLQYRLFVVGELEVRGAIVDVPSIPQRMLCNRLG